jgi:hypothetical protein
MAECTHPLFRHKSSKGRSMADYERERLPGQTSGRFAAMQPNTRFATVTDLKLPTPGARRSDTSDVSAVNPSRACASDPRVESLNALGYRPRFGSSGKLVAGCTTQALYLIDSASFLLARVDTLAAWQEDARNHAALSLQVQMEPERRRLHAIICLASLGLHTSSMLI